MVPLLWKNFPSCKRNTKYNEEKLRKLSNLPTTVVTPRDVLHMNKNATHRHVIFAVGFSDIFFFYCAVFDVNLSTLLSVWRGMALWPDGECYPLTSPTVLTFFSCAAFFWSHSFLLWMCLSETKGVSGISPSQGARSLTQVRQGACFLFSPSLQLNSSSWSKHPQGQIN